MEKKWNEIQANDDEDAWEDYDGLNQWHTEGNKASSSKDSSYIFVDSTKVEEPAEAKESSPKKEGDFTYLESLKMVMEQQQKTLEMVLMSAAKN